LTEEPLQTTGEVTLEVEDLGICHFLICQVISHDAILENNILQQAATRTTA
jgi:hypothetical protein